MLEFLVFTYGMITMFVVNAMRRDRRMQRPSSQMVVAAGWGLFSLSSTLALLLAGLAVALALGFQPPMEGLAAAAL